MTSAQPTPLQQAIAHHQRGELAAAAEVYRTILARDPDNFDALHLLGVLRTQQGAHEEALALIRRAIAINPEQPAAHSNLGLVLHKRGELSVALASFDNALRLRPKHAGSLYNRGNVLRTLDRPQEALESYERALALDSNLQDAWFQRGNVLAALGRLDEALASYERAVAIQPELIEALNNRGLLLMQLGRHDEALASYERALSVKSDAVEVLNNRGNTYQALQRFDAAVDSLAQLVAIAPAYEYGRGRLLECRLHCADWEGADDAIVAVRQAVEAGERAIGPFAFLAISDSAALQLQCARIFVADKFPSASKPMWSGERYRHERIRLAYLSADFRDHPAAYLTAELFERHDRERFETIAISFATDDRSAMRSRLQRAFERFIDVRQQSDREIAALLHSLEIDIAVDLMGFTAESRAGVLAWRPAPVQVSYLGFPGTMGTDYIDYILADRFVIPEAQQRHYAEHVVYLPDTFQANDSERAIAAQTPTRGEAGLPEAGFVFCSFNTTLKIAPRMFDVWMRLLTRCAGSVLWLLGSSANVQANLRREAARRGVDPDRLVFAARLPYAEHLARYRLADLFLDTLPFNAGATASDALWAGLPLLTCCGDAFAARMAGSLLDAIGMSDLVTHSLDEYESLALKLAGDVDFLRDIKYRLAANRVGCPLFDSDRFRRHIEAAYRWMWERCQRGEPPAGRH